MEYPSDEDDDLEAEEEEDAAMKGAEDEEEKSVKGVEEMEEMSVKGAEEALQMPDPPPRPTSSELQQYGMAKDEPITETGLPFRPPSQPSGTSDPATQGESDAVKHQRYVPSLFCRHCSQYFRSLF